MTLWADTHTPISPEKQTIQEPETLQGYEAISEQNSELRILYQTQCEAYFAYTPGYPTYPPSTGKWVHVTVRVTKDPAIKYVSRDRLNRSGQRCASVRTVCVPCISRPKIRNMLGKTNSSNFNQFSKFFLPMIKIKMQEQVEKGGKTQRSKDNKIKTSISHYP